MMTRFTRSRALMRCLVVGTAALALGCASTVTGSGSDAAPDAGHPDIVETDVVDIIDVPQVCTTSLGHSCPDGTLCPAEEGCNFCQCSDFNRDLSQCTAALCTTPAPHCQSSADCPGQRCLFFQGCSRTEGRCVLSMVPGREMTLCGCDSVTFTSSHLDRPYAHAGACP